MVSGPWPKSAASGMYSGQERGEEALDVGGGAGGGDDDGGAGVDGVHAGGLAGPVLEAVLDDAERVDPQVAQVEAAGDGDGVLEGPREYGEGDRGLARSEGGESGGEGLRASPTVAEGGERSDDWVRGLKEADRGIGLSANVEDAGGERGGGGRRARRVFGQAFRKPALRERNRDGAVWIHVNEVGWDVAGETSGCRRCQLLSPERWIIA